MREKISNYVISLTATKYSGKETHDIPRDKNLYLIRIELCRRGFSHLHSRNLLYETELSELSAEKWKSGCVFMVFTVSSLGVQLGKLVYRIVTLPWLRRWETPATVNRARFLRYCWCMNIVDSVIITYLFYEDIFFLLLLLLWRNSPMSGLGLPNMTMKLAV
jgi:hypothetical protein